MQVDEAKQSSSGLQFHLHPLVLINVSDHHTRTKANTPSSSSGAVPRVMGCLLGQQSGRTVDISNSFEIKYDQGPEGLVINDSFLQKKMEQYKQVFPALDVVGWYSTGAETDLDTDMALHKRIMEINEAPVYLRLDTAISPAAKDLPVFLHESELHVLDDVPTTIFVQAKYTVETSEAERIGVDQVAKILPTGAASGANQLTAHLTSMHSAIKMLVSRIALLHQMLVKMQSGELPFDHGLVRQVAGLVQRLPAVDSLQFSQDYLTEYNEALLTIMLSSVTQGSNAVNELVEKYNLAYDRTAVTKRAPKGSGGGMGSLMAGGPLLDF
ncbi:hypothetical protein N2152v2_008471 [Parachlorella kessleri]